MADIRLIQGSSPASAPTSIAESERIAYAALYQLSSDQLAATMRLLIWTTTTQPTDVELWARALATFQGNERFASLVATALRAIKHPQIH